MVTLLDYLNTTDLAPALPLAEAQSLAVQLGRLADGAVYPASPAAINHALYFLGKKGVEKFLGILAPVAPAEFTGAAQPVVVDGRDFVLTVAPTSTANAAALRKNLPFLVARTLGLAKSAGCGDRLGLATPGHLRAIRRSTMAPIVTQQSIRENERTGRTPQEVMDDAMWGVFQEGWRDGFGADADHLKNTADIDSCAAAGYTFFTIDPGAHVDNAADSDSIPQLEAKSAALPWDALESSPADTQNRLADCPINLGDFSLTISREDLLRATVKYGKAIAHTVKMYRHLLAVKAGQPFELEMSVDETDSVTSLAEHVYIVHELKRLGVKWVSLAPRYVGSFEKGVDYIGDPAEFEASFARHVAVAKTYGPYKLSLHSGSDKFSVYPIVAKLAGDWVHLKTAGTSYLEALRAIALLNPALFRRIAAFAVARYPTDRATYHVSAQTDKMPDVSALADADLPALLEDFHAREILHVTFGSVLHHPDFRGPFFATLRGDEETYYAVLEKHFSRHFAPFQG